MWTNVLRKSRLALLAGVNLKVTSAPLQYEQSCLGVLEPYMIIILFVVHFLVFDSLNVTMHASFKLCRNLQKAHKQGRD